MQIAAMYSAITHDVHITATPAFSPDRSEPAANRYFWTYTIEIVNRGPIQVQLLERHWRITDANGRVETVKGPGVIGETPILEPEEASAIPPVAASAQPRASCRAPIGWWISTAAPSTSKYPPFRSTARWSGGFSTDLQFLAASCLVLHGA